MAGRLGSPSTSTFLKMLDNTISYSAKVDLGHLEFAQEPPPQMVDPTLIQNVQPVSFGSNTSDERAGRPGFPNNSLESAQLYNTMPNSSTVNPGQLGFAQQLPLPMPPLQGLLPEQDSILLQKDVLQPQVQ